MSNQLTRAQVEASIIELSEERERLQVAHYKSTNEIRVKLARLRALLQRMPKSVPETPFQ